MHYGYSSYYESKPCALVVLFHAHQSTLPCVQMYKTEISATIRPFLNDEDRNHTNISSKNPAKKHNYVVCRPLRALYVGLFCFPKPHQVNTFLATLK